MLKEIKSAFKNGTKQLLWLDEATRDAVDVKVCRLFSIYITLVSLNNVVKIFKDVTKTAYR